ncbi:heat-shock protein Hsp90 [Nonlabens mediterrranea]|uniref:Heat-shock protein Hsp90 n=1 Tax=Nonlabens mediterrranea TaxID=1419947 RepID=A0ABS0A7E7_9FLAO|nr:heat-shock protein Hsp90 [Nonlabens mediterrranea]
MSIIIRKIIMKKILLICMAVMAITSCKETSREIEVVEDETIVNDKVDVTSITPFTAAIEMAHKKDLFLEKDAIQYDFSVAFGGNTIFEGVVTQETDGSMIHMTKENGSVIVFDGNQVYATDAEDLKNPMTRFHIFTWPYFFSMPYKLNDKGTIWEEEEMMTWGDASFPTARLSFENGVGDTSEDWYEVYKNPDNNVLAGVAYIVSYGKGVEEAEKEPHAAKYNELTTIDGVPFATNWSFHNWTSQDGYTDQIGLATIKNIKFVNKEKSFYAQPDGAGVVSMPGE